MTRRTTAGVATLGFNAVALGCLLILHVVSPEFDPSWRMVSEYARCGFAWLLAVFFVASGAGELLASVFDITHPLHDLAGYLGTLCLPVAALLIHRGLTRPGSGAPGASHLGAGAALVPLGALVVFVATFVVLMVTYASSGATVDPNSPTAKLPEGVVALVGWANRALVLAFTGWASLLAWGCLVRPRANGVAE